MDKKWLMARVAGMPFRTKGFVQCVIRNSCKRDYFVQAFLMVITLPRKKAFIPKFIPRDEFMIVAEEAAQKRHTPDPADLKEFMEILTPKVPPLSLTSSRIHRIFKAALTEHIQIKPPETPLSDIGLEARASVMGFDVVARYIERHRTPCSVVSLFPR